MPCTETCDFEPFNSVVTPEGSDVDILRNEIQDYLTRLKDQICADLQCIDQRIAALEARVTALEAGP